MKFITLLIFTASISHTLCQETIDAKAVTLVNHFKSGDFAAATAMFAEELRPQIPENALSGMWDQISMQSGKLKKTSFNCSEINDSITIAYVTCEFQNQTFDFKIAFDIKQMVMAMMPTPTHVCGVEEKTATWIAPPYDNPEKYTFSDFEVINGEYKLPGTLTMPVENEKSTVIVFVHGSGPNDRDESAFGNKTFKDLALGFAINGFATVRYDKRTFAHKIKNPDTFNIYEEVTEDVDAVIDWISTHKQLKTKNIVVLGHSLGGMMAPYIGVNNEKVAGLILMAGPSGKFEDLIAYQVELLANMDGNLDKQEKAAIKDMKRRVALVKSDFSDTTPPSDLPLSLTAAYWQSIKEIDQVSLAKNYDNPILVMNGERDYQVPMTEFERWKTELDKKETVTFVSFPKLNHLFFEGDGTPNPNEYATPSNVPEYVITEMIAWLDKL